MESKCIDKLNAEGIDSIEVFHTFTSLLIQSLPLIFSYLCASPKPRMTPAISYKKQKKQKAQKAKHLFHNTCTMDFDADRIYYSHQNLHQQQDGSQEGQNPTTSSASLLEDEEERQVDADALRRHFREFLRKFKSSTLFVLCQMQFIDVFTNDCQHIIK